MEITNTGYYVGNLYDFLDKEQLNQLEPFIENVKNSSIDNTDMSYRFDYSGGGNYSDNRIKEEDIKKREDFISKNNYITFQRWWEFNLKNPNNSEYFDNISLKIANHLYPEYDITIDSINSRGGYTLFKIGDFIGEHEDGWDEDRLCVILIYLSDNWKDGDGGELIIKNKEQTLSVPPKLGNFAVLDFTKHNVSHSVLPVNNEFKRFTYLHFVNFKKQDTDTYTQFKKNKLEFKH